jgi:hypothetical protein
VVELPESERSAARPQQLIYRADVRIPAEQAPAAGTGLRIRIDGRLAASPAPPIVCRSEGAGLRPSCFLVARFETIAVTSAAGDRVFAEWSQ